MENIRYFRFSDVVNRFGNQNGPDSFAARGRHGTRSFAWIGGLALLTAFVPNLAAHGTTYAIAVDPGNSSRIYAGTDDGVLVSADGGSTWADANSGLPFARVTALAIDRSNPSTIYAGSLAVFKSTDGGSHWTSTGSGIPAVALGVAALTIDPSNSSVIYAGLFANTGPGVMISRDGGGTWTLAGGDVLPNTTFDGIVIDPHNTSTVYAASMSGGMFKSSDSGHNWTEANNGLPALTDNTNGLPAIHIHALAIDPINPSVLYARVRGGAVYKTLDNGGTWAPANNGLSESKDLASFVSALAIDPTNPLIVYTGSISGGLFKSIDGGATWIPANTGLPSGSGSALAIDPTNPSIIYAGTDDGRVFKSTNGASTFLAGPDTATPLSGIGSLAQIASAGTWKMTLNFLNLGTGAAQIQTKFYDNNGSPMILPMSFPQTPSSGQLPSSSLDRTLSAGSQLVVESTGPDTSDAKVGWSRLFGDSSISGFGIFSNASLGWNAVVPLETRNTSSYILAFDNSGDLATGVAVANVATTAASIPLIVRDDTGVQIQTDTISLAAQGHDSFTLKSKYPATAGRRGTVEFVTPNFGAQTPGQISVLGLRANGAALTTLPVLAGVDTTGGSIAHATYNNGFTSVFYMVNTGSVSSSFTLSFFDETTGSPLAVPLILPQSGSSTTTAAITRTLAAGAMLVIETQAQDALATVSGSAQLTTNGNISGFEIFRWTTFGQEASVPVETRTPGSFILAFDDTNGLTTGVALANRNTTPAGVTAKIYDDTGALLDTQSISLAARGHTSFLLPNAYALTTNKRGMVEFMVPTSGQISVIGLRAKADGTLTTIPVLVK